VTVVADPRSCIRRLPAPKSRPIAGFPGIAHTPRWTSQCKTYLGERL